MYLWKFLALISFLAFASSGAAQTPDQGGDASNSAIFDWTVLTSTPAETLDSFTRMSQQLEAAIIAYRTNKSRTNYENILLISDQLVSLFDLSSIAEIYKLESGLETIASLLDIFGRIGFPNPQLAPGASSAITNNAFAYSIPETPFRIVRMTDGARSGEWLFEGRTVKTAPVFLRRIETQPVGPLNRIRDWSLLLKQTTGPFFPRALVKSFPEQLNQLLLGTPLWKVILTLCLAALTVAVSTLWLRMLEKVQAKENGSRRLFVGILGPAGVALGVYYVSQFISLQLNLLGTLSTLAGITTSIIYWVSLAWAFWLLTTALIERIMEKNNLAQGSVDANMVHLCARVLGVIGCVIIVAIGAQTIGVPVLSLVAGLGVGGLAVALAIRPTLENLIGGIVLFLDKPIRINEYCSFGEKSGTVEKIGARSVQIRALDRTTITIPNSLFADMEIINWSRCDRMHINQTMGLRHETTNEQLQYILAKTREMFHAHPKIDGDTARAMFVGHSKSALNIRIMAYVNSPIWSEFFAVREDAFLRIKKIIEDAGTYFAAPTQTVYVQRGTGLDLERAEKVTDELQNWRQRGEFPFPNFADDTIERLRNQIEYPVPGSPDHCPIQTDFPESGERK